MGIPQKKRRTTGKKALACRGKGGQNTDIAFLALRSGVVLYRPSTGVWEHRTRDYRAEIQLQFIW